MFQSPYGDYLVRNVSAQQVLQEAKKFQSPYGDYLVRNPQIYTGGGIKTLGSFSPLTGIT